MEFSGHRFLARGPLSRNQSPHLQPLALMAMTMLMMMYEYTILYMSARMHAIGRIDRRMRSQSKVHNQ